MIASRLKRAGGAAIALFAASAMATPPTSFQSVGVGGGGALFSPSFSPHNSDLYVSCDMSELFRSTTQGASWTVVPFTEMQGNRSTQVQFTNNANILYTIDHTGETPTPSKSTDGGATWTPLANDPTGGECYSICADPTDSNRLLVSDYTNVFLSTNGGSSFTSKINEPGGCYVGGAFWNGANIYVGTGVGLYVSTNGGTSFSKAGVPQIAGQGIVTLTGAVSGPTTRLMAAMAPQGDLYPGILLEIDLYGLASPLGVYTLDWGAGAWAAKQTGLDSDDRIIFVGMARNDINKCYAVGGSSLQDWPALYKSTNAGGTWTNTFLTNNNQNIVTGWSGDGGDRGWGYGGGATGFAVSPIDANIAAYSDYGFVHRTTNFGGTWTQSYVAPADQNPAGSDTPVGKAYHSAGIEDTTNWRLTWLDANNIWASYSDIRGIRSTDGGATWSFNYSGHTANSSYQCVKHPTNGRVYLATSSVHDIYQTTRLTDATLDGGSGQILTSTNNGTSWTTLHNFSNPVIDMCIDPNNSNTMYASVIDSANGGIYRTTDLATGTVWTKLTNPPRTQGHPFNIKVLNDGTLVATYCGRYASGSFTDSSGVFVSTNGGTSWNDRSDANMHYYVKDITIDPTDASQNRWYACVWSGYNGPTTTNNEAGGLYRTTNRGVNWTRINSLYRVSSCTINPLSANEMYVTTEQEGLWYSSNALQPTPTLTQLTAYPFRQPERVYFNPFNAGELWVTSFGGGTRRATIPVAAVEFGEWQIY